MRREGHLVWVMFNTPSVNATSHSVRHLLMEAVDAVTAMEVEAAVLRCSWSTLALVPGCFGLERRSGKGVPNFLYKR